ncbi:MAG TPA: bifunctional (p)ppGpp synthetase/guanosine-3',5'-bis(diphosphate) 3'-pyrophosphohydrolase [Dehalococcoidia bacterium]|nr:bifunctional (p)ppGpp synthetase/guanosine-3',5'-bis(diphosphate) 3'-pyrophosphohydrolase [Dehalococcoidia bacterium]
MEVSALLELTRAYLSSDKLVIIRQAYEFALKAHEGQLRRSGEPYLQHPLETAAILADLKLDAASIAAALLHDVPEDCGVPIEDIEAKFGPEVAKLVDGVTKLSQISGQVAEKPTRDYLQAESLRKMLVAMAEDLRVVFIKLADRLHNMRTLEALPLARRRAVARETLEVYAPLAHRLGIGKIQSELEDLAFYNLDPLKYRHVKHLLTRREVEQELLVKDAVEVLQKELEKAGLRAKVSGRSKSVYSIQRKMERYGQLGRNLDDIHDIIAIRVLVDKVEECYHALGIIHSLWHPIGTEFNDYIATPKENGYRSLHTTVMCFNVPLEVQVRTYEMHESAEYGLSAHWVYKEGVKQDEFGQRIARLRQLLEWHKEITGTAQFLELVKADVFQDQVFVYTPKGEIKNLPAGSTPVDFAYHIHSGIGHRCIGAKVNGKLVPLTTYLRNGDTVEILVGKAGKGPSRDWLNPNLGYVNTSRARDRIRQWFRKETRAESIEKGREVLEKEMKRLGMTLGNREELAHVFKYEDVDDFYAAIGYGDLSASQVTLKMAVQEEQPKIKGPLPSAATAPLGIKVLGSGDLLTRLAKCCSPLPGDDIVGYITRTTGVTVHRKDCPNVVHEKERERLVEVEWGRTDQLYPVWIRVDAWDRVGLVRDITTVVSNEGVNIASMKSLGHGDNSASVFLTLETKGVAQLSRLLSKIEGIGGVTNVVRGSE